MKTEKVILSFIAVVAGLLVAMIGFFLYQKTKPSQQTTPDNIIHLLPTITPIATPSLPLIIDQPISESASKNKVITITGRTSPDATIIISNAIDSQVLTPTATGSFATSLPLDDGVNNITILSIARNGEETQKTIIITYSTEEF